MAAEENLSKSLYKIELYILKIIPMIMALLCLVNTTLFYFSIDAPILTYIGGVSFLTIGFLYLSSFVLVGIAPTSSQEEFFNTIVHEAKHVQSHICNYYNVSEEGEQAAYLIGYIVQKMHKIFKYMISTGVK